MTFAEFRTTRGLSLEECCLALGLSAASKGHLSRIENGHVPWPMELALEVEVWSQGAVRALDLLTPAKAALLRRAIQRNAVGATETSPA